MDASANSSRVAHRRAVGTRRPVDGELALLRSHLEGDCHVDTSDVGELNGAPYGLRTRVTALKGRQSTGSAGSIRLPLYSPQHRNYLIPVISANTAARREGYFRLEWWLPLRPGRRQELLRNGAQLLRVFPEIGQQPPSL